MAKLPLDYLGKHFARPLARFVRAEDSYDFASLRTSQRTWLMVGNCGRSRQRTYVENRLRIYIPLYSQLINALRETIVPFDHFTRIVNCKQPSFVSVSIDDKHDGPYR